MASDVRPSEAQARWSELGYGLFVHFGLNTFAEVAWGDGRFPAERFTPELLDCRQWARIAAEAGMRYGVLTAKHHDGFCLWPTEFTDYSVRRSAVGRDVVGEFVEAFREQGLAVGLYYSLWDRHCPCYEDDAAYALYVRAQVEELLRAYGPLVELWFDGGWDKEHPTRRWEYDPIWTETIDPVILRGGRWGWEALYEHIHRLQPDCLVVNNSGSDRPGWPRYHPVDLRTAEHFHFVHASRLHEPPRQEIFADHTGRQVNLPLEFCTTLTPDWFCTGKHFSHASAEAIASWYTRARSFNGNLLLNIGPDRRGLIPEYHRPFVDGARKLIDASEHG